MLVQGAQPQTSTQPISQVICQSVLPLVGGALKSETGIGKRGRKVCILDGGAVHSPNNKHWRECEAITENGTMCLHDGDMTEFD